jgi:transposase-like protein
MVELALKHGNCAEARRQWIRKHGNGKVPSEDTFILNVKKLRAKKSVENQV